MPGSDTRRLKVVVSGDSSGGQQAIEAVGNSAEKADSKLATLAKTIGGFAGKGVIALGAMGAAATTMGITTATRLEQVSVGFTTMLGSATKAQAFLKKLQDFANTTPFEFEDVTGAAQKFLSMGFAAKDVIPMLTAVGDAVAAMGGSAENIDAVTTALSQMQVKGKVSGEEMMQLSEQGIPALQILADSFGVSTQKMTKMISNGQVMSDRAIPAIIKGLEHGTKSVKGFGGMMQAQSQTMAGKWSTFMDTLKSGLGNLAVNLLPMAKKAVDVASGAFQNFFAGLQGKGKLKGFSGTLNEIGLGLRAMVSAFKEGDVTSKGLVGKFELIGAAARGVITAFQTGKITSEGWQHELQLVAVVIKKLIDGSIWLAGATKSLIGWFRQHEAVAKTLLGVMGALVAITKLHAIVTGVQTAGGLLAMAKSTALVTSVTKVATAVQWAWNGAISAAKYLQIAGYLAAVSIQQKAVAVGSKIATAAQWLWNSSFLAFPGTWIVLAIVAVVGAIILLWKKSETFRNWVLGTLWPSLKRAWEDLKNIFWTVVNSIVKAWDYTKQQFINVWNQIFNFFKPIVNAIITTMTPIVKAINKIASVLIGFYTAVWKIIWILIQIAVKAFVAYFEGVVLPKIKFVIAVVTAIVGMFVAYWKDQWNRIVNIAKGFVNWITGTLVPKTKQAWAILMAALNIWKNFFISAYNTVRDKVRSAFQAIAGPIAAIFNKALATIRGWLATFRAGWNTIFDGIRNKVADVMNRIVGSFNKGKDGIKAAWDKVVALTKRPINFVINDVYNNRIMPLWNKIAEKFGISTRLDPIKGFNKGGIAPGSGNKDTLLALLTPGEGILSKKDMAKIGGPKGFVEFRQSLAKFHNGGVAGGTGDGPGSWFKSLISKGKNIFQGVAGTIIKPLVNAVRSMINNNLQGGGFTGLMRGGANTILNKLVSWVTGKDKEIPPLGSLGAGKGEGFGWKWMRSVIARRFPGLGMISGFRPGAHTLSGALSYHALGRAVDYPPSKALALWIRATWGRVTKELITPWNELNLHNGRPHRYTGAVWNQHNFAGGNAHDHWAMDKITTVAPGPFVGYNGTGKKETLVNADLIPGGVVINGGLHLHGVQDVKGLRDELQKLAKRNGGRAGVPGK